MSANLFEPRRLRESPEGPSSVDGRLARQLRILSVGAATPQLRRYSVLSRRRRYISMAVRIASAATIVLALSGAATATATYVVRQVLSRTTMVAHTERPVSLPSAKHASKSWNPPYAVESAIEPAVPALPKAQSGVAAVASGAATTSAEGPGTLPSGSRSVALRQSGRPAAGSAAGSDRPPEEGPQSPLAAPLQPPRSPVVPLPLVAPTTVPSVPEPLPAAPLPAAGGSSTPAGAAPPQVRADAVTQEAELLRQALAALRRDHDAKRALHLLDDYDRRFGRGALAQEADATRAQALLQLGDNPHALAILDRLPFGQEGHTGELRVIRGELRSLSGRCQDALLDFDAVLRATPGSASTEIARALFGRASCRARIGDAVGAQADRQRYLKEFPHGPAVRQLSSPP